MTSIAVAGGTGWVVLLSIVGIDRVDMGYYQAKRAQEDLVREGPVPSPSGGPPSFTGSPRRCWATALWSRA